MGLRVKIPLLCFSKQDVRSTRQFAGWDIRLRIAETRAV